jgi:type I restriction enzyme S subunit
MVRYLRSANVKDGTLDLTDVQSMNFTPAEQRIFALRPGDVLVSEGSGSLSSVGASAVWRGELDEMVCFQNTLLRLRPRAGVDGRYLEWWARSAFGSGVFASIASGANIYHLSAERVRALPISVPPMEEQRRIADFLDAETARISRLMFLRNDQITRIEERYLSAISEYSTPGITSSARRSDRWPWLPDGLEVARLGYYARVQTGVTVHGERARSPEDEEYPYLRVANVQNGTVDLTEVKSIVVPPQMAEQAKLRDGDVVITEANGNPDNLGRGAVWHNEIPGMIHQNHVFAIRTNKGKLDPEYLAALLASAHGRRYFRFTSSQVGIATTSSSKVLDFPIPVREMGEQKRVVEECESARCTADRAVQLLQQQCNLLAERRQALITAAVTGQIDVPTASGRGIEE